MTPYDDLIARISDLIRDGDRTVKARAEDIFEAVREYATSDEAAGRACDECQGYGSDSPSDRDYMRDVIRAAFQA